MVNKSLSNILSAIDENVMLNYFLYLVDANLNYLFFNILYSILFATPPFIFQ